MFLSKTVHPSGQIVGKIGRTVTKMTNGKMVIPKIFALDPSGKKFLNILCFLFPIFNFPAPNFEFNPVNGFEAISKTDATYVQIIHTNGGILGMQMQAGTADFYPNGGVRQTG